MQLLALCTVVIIASFVARRVFRALADPLRSIPGPSLARWTRLWELREVRRGYFEKTNIRLHQCYGWYAFPFVILKLSHWFYRLNRANCSVHV
jgi:hypothetical protein